MKKVYKNPQTEMVRETMGAAVMVDLGPLAGSSTMDSPTAVSARGFDAVPVPTRTPGNYE